jgi:hypothetical protein
LFLECGTSEKIIQVSGKVLRLYPYQRGVWLKGGQSDFSGTELLDGRKILGKETQSEFSEYLDG